MPSNTEGRFRLDKPAPATVRCPESWGGGRRERRGLQVSPELPGRGPGVPQAEPVRGRGGLGSLGKVRPRLAWHRCLGSHSLSLVCVGVHIVSACA